MTGIFSLFSNKHYSNPPTRVGVTRKYLMQDPNDGKSKIQNPKSKIQNPKSKIQTGPFGAATKRTKTKLIQNPKSEIQNPKSKIRNPKSKIQNPKSEIQNPKSKRAVWSLDFGFWIWSGRDRGRWPCSK